jgi:hypothetical protein
MPPWLRSQFPRRFEFGFLLGRVQFALRGVKCRSSRNYRWITVELLHQRRLLKLEL